MSNRQVGQVKFFMRKVTGSLSWMRLKRLIRKVSMKKPKTRVTRGGTRRPVIACAG
ncbi:hypothetical protein Lalb_Chr05g0216471 [Lupinus albus]|uniref:Uncharacterized protein n=1 Tax=Lupinus albus TaxID=3870 RepID=A0A6A4QJF8_LUPAL|nr:hypothetical protein Lalb_Chr05g0216471 [Lupinus albus]